MRAWKLMALVAVALAVPAHGGEECREGEVHPCGSGVGECREGQQMCVRGRLGPCEGERGPQKEVCDGLDNDCDGKVDQGDPGGGGTCDTGEAGVCAPGTRHCQEGQLVCRRQVDPFAESCDGKDNDCNGQVDEGDPGGGGSCDTGEPGVCSEGIRHCRKGKLVCGRLQEPGAEVCDGLDNDCDGKTDQGDPGGGGTCDTGEPGVCSPGTRSCQGGKLVCSRKTDPSAEACDGLDNDCNGQVDDGDPGGGQECSTGKAGVCSAGKKRCQKGKLVCLGLERPSAEVCDGLDNDCNGQVDEGDPGGGGSCDTGEPGVCSPGVKHCRGGKLVCQRKIDPSKEVCDGKDNDCNGQADENDPGGGGACSTGQPGVCSAGVRRCQGGKLVCSRKLDPSKEVCDGRDNDCDGRVDDGNPGGGRSCETGEKGVCAAGLTLCSGGRITCRRVKDPSKEVCDRADNDCDGIVDDGLSWDNDADGHYTANSCATPRDDCNDKDPTIYGRAPELCDGKDNDCDGKVDEGDPEGGVACNTGKPGLCAAGVQHCRQGRKICEDTTTPKEEICDGNDNDCDGEVDEGLSWDADADGHYTSESCARPNDDCNDTDSSIFGGAMERCDSKDNDCDGEVDEGDPEAGRECSTGFPGKCGAGITRCVEGHVVCKPKVKTTPEICDGKDNDCDGQIDEGGACKDAVAMVLIQGGTFTMGDPKGKADDAPGRKVKLNTFYIDKNEATNGQYKACVFAGGCTKPASQASKTQPMYFAYLKYDNSPVVNVTWEQARSYCEWAGKRLPTEAEWEMAARGLEDGRSYPWGDAAPSCTTANVRVGERFCKPDVVLVGSYQKGASPFGVMDMAGNVWEWVADWYGQDYYKWAPSMNPKGPPTGTRRVVKGGSFLGSGNFGGLIPTRHSLMPDDYFYDVGFRCAR